MKLTFADAQRNVAEIANRETYNQDVIFELLAAYGRSASAITKLRSGTLNLAEDKDNDVLQRGVVYFRHISDGNLISAVDSLDKDPLVVRYYPRYLIATDYEQLVAKDTKKGTTLDIKLRDIDRNVDFFYGWTGDEVTSEKTEAVADRRAADKMKDLYAEIARINSDKFEDEGSNFRHHLNVFFSRLLFCFFAEDTKVFSREVPSIFTDSIKDFTQTDGSDLDEFLSNLFEVLDTREDERQDLSSPYTLFPYVNGTIFDTKKHEIAIPKFNAQARKLILECGNHNWAQINPDIFGSMFQSIVDEVHRSDSGMHYTSVPNILKTIEPLFLNELREEFDKYYDDNRKLMKLWDRISKIKVFDPACGSGNFLIIAYKELRKIEHAIIERLYMDRKDQLEGALGSRVQLDNFYGIEIDDFAHEIAILSLYLAKHQMNIEFEEHFGKEIILIPLKDNAKIVRGNATRLDWQEVCPNKQRLAQSKTAEQQFLLEIPGEHEQESLISEEALAEKTWDEIYLIGNPPYQGSKRQTKEQKSDIEFVFSKSTKKYRDMDYISCWFFKGSSYIKGTNAKLAFVSTNSISQGIQVELIWPLIFQQGNQISFVHESFKWNNNAKGQAGVTCVIVGLAHSSCVKRRYIYDGLVRKEVPFINAYLADGPDVIVGRRPTPLFKELPKMQLGNMAVDDGNLILTAEEKHVLLSKYPDASKLVRRLYGSKEYIKGLERYCLWIKDVDLQAALSIPDINSRIDAVKVFRLKSKDASSKKLASRPHQFREMHVAIKSSIILPRVSSERRDYIPFGFLDNEAIVSDSAQALYDADSWLFALLSSRMHMVWVRAVAGKLETRYRYSSAIVYNNFPIRPLLEKEKLELSNLARNILFARENHSEKTLSEMYDPDKMPEDLRNAHHELDLMVDKLYSSKPYSNDKERLTDLFKLYEEMTAEDKEKII